jgi:hypothetical protein
VWFSIKSLQAHRVWNSARGFLPLLGDKTMATTLQPEHHGKLSHHTLWQVVVPKTVPEYTSRRVLTSAWLEGEKLSQSTADDVGQLVKLGVICYLKQLLDTGCVSSAWCGWRLPMARTGKGAAEG